MTPLSRFGPLPEVPFNSLHKPRNTLLENSYAFVLSDGTLSLQKTDSSFPEGETDLAKITQFVHAHFEGLPEQSKSLIPHQLNFLIEKHNQKEEGNRALIGRIQIPAGGEEETWLSAINQKQLFESFKSLERFWPDFASCIERPTTISEELGTTYPSALISQGAVLQKISKIVSRTTINETVTTILLGPLEENEPSDLEKNRAILKEIAEIFAPRTIQEILEKEVFTGSPEEIAAIDRAYKELEDKATIALYETLAGKQIPYNRNSSIAKKAEKARKWVNRRMDLSTVHCLDLSEKNLSLIPKEIEKLSKLTALALFKNKIRTIPANMNWPATLTGLDLSCNEIASLPENLQLPGSLEHICLYANRILSVPGGLQKPGLDVWWNGSLDTLLAMRLGLRKATSPRTEELITQAVSKTVHSVENLFFNIVVTPPIYLYLTMYYLINENTEEFN